MEFKKYKCKIKDEIYFLLDQIKSKKTKKFRGFYILFTKVLYLENSINNHN